MARISNLTAGDADRAGPAGHEGVETGWHAGERAAQKRAGVARRMAELGPRVLRGSMSDQHRMFFAQLPFLVVASLDRQGWPWSSVLSGPPGFARSPDPLTLAISAKPETGDLLAEHLREGASLGLLGIELPTRRRNRLNGHVVRADARGFALRVDQSFGNCPQYIHVRDYAGWSWLSAQPARAEPFETPTSEAAALISRADTAFLASSAGLLGGLDASHRGGMPGFMKLDRDGAILLPDCRGNFFFNTLGNVMAYPRLGLTVVDFDTGDLLQATGAADILWEGGALGQHPGAQRLVRLAPMRGQWLRGGFPLATLLREMSPQAVATLGQPPA